MASLANAADHVDAAEAALLMLLGGGACPRRAERDRAVRATQQWLADARSCAEAWAQANGAGRLVFCESLEVSCEDALAAISIACDFPQ